MYVHSYMAFTPIFYIKHGSINSSTFMPIVADSLSQMDTSYILSV